MQPSTLALCHGLAGSQHYPVYTVAQQYRRWMLSKPFDVGHATVTALGYVDLNSPTQHEDMVMRASTTSPLVGRVGYSPPMKRG